MRATEPINVKKIQEAQRQHQFEGMAHHFFERWQPKDPQEAAEFSAHLFTLVRQVYSDAAEPLTNQLIRVMNAMPSPIMQPRDTER